MVTFDLVLRTRASLHTDGEPDQFVSEYHGTVRCQHESGEEATVGRVRALRVNAGTAADRGYPLFDVCDCHSQELHVLHALLYRPDTYRFRRAVQRRFEAFETDLLVLDYVVLDPKWRGLRVGLLAARRLVNLAGGGCGLVVSDIAPLRRATHKQLEVPADWIPPVESREANRAATEKLPRHFRRMGFTRLGRTIYFALPTASRTPTVEEILKRNPGPA